ncbi:hypothetical protein BgiBS90_028951 [Biomphalaria glabrata]|nr:hypothetical protein BgiBS90_028951 [Biomphalaria glabrata]
MLRNYQRKTQRGSYGQQNLTEGSNNRKAMSGFSCTDKCSEGPSASSSKTILNEIIGPVRAAMPRVRKRAAEKATLLTASPFKKRLEEKKISVPVSNKNRPTEDILMTVASESQVSSHESLRTVTGSDQGYNPVSNPVDVNLENCVDVDAPFYYNHPKSHLFLILKSVQIHLHHGHR